MPAQYQGPEHPGRTRGVGVVPWYEGFAEYSDTYKSRSRKKQQETDRFQKLEQAIKEQAQMLKQHQEQYESLSQQLKTSQWQLDEPPNDPALDSTIPSMPKSSVGSTGDALLAHCPVDDIQESTSCELRYRMNNISIKVADGIALPNPPGATYHGNPVPPGYARVGVDEVLSGYEELNLDFPGGEGEQTLIEAKHNGYFLWRKQFIILPDKVPSPPHHPSPPHPPETERSGTPRRQSSPPPPPETKPSGRTTRRRYPSPKRQQSPNKKRAKTKKPEPPVEKLPWERTDAENKAISDKEVKEHFAPKPPPPPKEKIPEETVQHFLDNAKPAVKKRLSNYERSITKSFLQKQSSSSGSKKCGRTVPQLGEQAVQSITPLKVSTEQEVVIADASREAAARALGTTVEQMIGLVEIPTLDVIPIRKFVKGEPLVTIDEEKLLPTQMRNLHQWYKKEIKIGRESLMVKVKPEYYYHKNEVWIEDQELFQLFHQKALDKSLVSCFCL